MTANKPEFDVRLLGLFLPLLVAVAIASAGCEPEAKITFDNQRSHQVVVRVAHVRVDGTTDELTERGIIPANTTKTLYITFLGKQWVNRIQAMDPSGKVLLSLDYKLEDLEKINWKITIPP